MKYWLIIFFLTPDGEFVGKKETQYENEAVCRLAMSKVPPKEKYVNRPICVSDDHYSGRKQDPGVDYD